MLILFSQNYCCLWSLLSFINVIRYTFIFMCYRYFKSILIRMYTYYSSDNRIQFKKNYEKNLKQR